MDDGKEIEKEDGDGDGGRVEVNFESYTHGFTPHHYKIFLSLVPKPLS